QAPVGGPSALLDVRAPAGPRDARLAGGLHEGGALADRGASGLASPLHLGLLRHTVLQQETLRAPGARTMPAPQPCIGSAPTLTSCLPRFWPRSSPMNARGAFSSPSTMSSRYFNRPALSHAVQSRRKSGRRSAWSLTMKPRTVTRLPTTTPRLGPAGSSVALYCETWPQSGIRANGLICRSTAFSTSPPTLSK